MDKKEIKNCKVEEEDFEVVDEGQFDVNEQEGDNSISNRIIILD